VAQQALDPLTIRERQVLHLIAEGMSINEVGDTLQLSVTVVETIRSQIMQKLNMDSVALLVQYAMQNGLIPG
jgi:DNA-binding NarL/FixJ family response regulator